MVLTLDGSEHIHACIAARMIPGLGIKVCIEVRVAESIAMTCENLIPNVCQRLIRIHGQLAVSEHTRVAVRNDKKIIVVIAGVVIIGVAPTSSAFFT